MAAKRTMPGVRELRALASFMDATIIIYEKDEKDGLKAGKNDIYGNGQSVIRLWSRKLSSRIFYTWIRLKETISSEVETRQWSM